MVFVPIGTFVPLVHEAKFNARCLEPNITKKQHIDEWLVFCECLLCDWVNNPVDNLLYA